MQPKRKPQIICLMGPTAAGKTQLAVELVARFGMDIISVDSAMVYRGMDIGTAKPDAAILQAAPHRLINILDPAEAYSAAAFRNDALREIADIVAHQRIPLLTGGTMLYFSVLQKGLSKLPAADVALRKRLTADANSQGWDAMHERLKQVDVTAAARIHPHDAQRIQRALEVHELTGKSLTEWQALEVELLSEYEVINLAVAPADRAVLHARIAQRFEEMLASGFVDEVRDLFERGDLTLELPSIRSVGYRQVWEYLLGQYDYAEMCLKGVAATRQLAKRQLTWLRQWPTPVEWFDSMAPDLSEQVVRYLQEVTPQPPKNAI
ncbi:MAG: tRNA (adenosine(37)-N6)-dimethylallyltransferase MiaA [Pseudomonadota bacterium]